MSVTAEESAALAAVAADAALAAGADLRAAFRGLMQIDYKKDIHDPVTEHDRRAESTIRDLITSRVPDSTVVGEEAGSQGSGRVHWYVDPIDGTSNFAGGLAFFCTSVGAMVDGEVVAGAINDPMARHLFTATVDGAFLNGEPIRSSGVPQESRALLVTSYPNNRLLDRDGDGALDRLGRLITAFGTVRRVGSAALTLAHVAAGWVDAAFGIGINAWDVAAGALLVRNSGAVYRPLWPEPATGRADIFAPGYLAHVPELAPDVLADVVAELVAARFVRPADAEIG